MKEFIKKLRLDKLRFFARGDCSVMLRTIAARRDDGDEIVVLVLVFASLEVFFGTTNVECCSSQNIMLLYSSTVPSIFTREPTL